MYLCIEMRLFFIYFFFSILCAADFDPWLVISAENEPSSLIDGKVSAITGKLALKETDLIVQGAQPIVISRTYVDGNWILFPSLQVEEATSHSKGHSYTIQENSGAKIRYKFTNQKEMRGDQLFRKYTPVDLENGYTNTSRGELSSRTHLSNNILWVGPKENQLILHLANGAIRTYHKVHHGLGKYNLTSEQLSNGTWMIYDYANKTELRSIRTTSPDRNLVYAHVNISYEHGKRAIRKIRIVGSDDQTVEYSCNETGVIVAMCSSMRSNQNFQYSPFRYPLHHFPNALQKISSPLDRNLQIDFYTAKTSWVHGEQARLENQEIRTNQKDNNDEWVTEWIFDPRCARVLSLSSPVGEDQTLHTTHTLLYDIPQRKTTLYDIENQKTEYRWDNHFRLTSIAQYGADATLQKTERFVWSSSGLLLCKTDIDHADRPLLAKRYFYNDKGDVLEEKTYGNLSGKGPPLLLGPDYVPIENGVEVHVRRFQYWEGRISLLRSVEDNFGKKIENTYLADTDLLLSQRIYDHGELQETKQWQYDANRLLIREVTKTQTAHLIRQITPKSDPPYFGMPWIIEEKYLDPKGQELLLRKTVLHYTKGAQICQKDIYDAKNQFSYSLYFKYDDKGRLIEETDAIGRIEQFRYDDCGNRIFHKHSSGRTIATFRFDHSNRRIASMQKGDDDVILNEEYTYDRKHRLTSEKKAFGYYATLHYDSFGHLSRKAIPSTGDCYSFLSDSFGRPILQTDPNGATTQTSYNAYGHPTRILHPDGGVEEFIYDLNGQLKTHIDQEGLETSYTYNIYGHVTSKTLSSKGEVYSQETALYAGPALQMKTDPEGNRTTYAYDPAGRVISTQFAGTITEYTYDSLSRLILEKTDEISTTKTYDLLDRLVEESRGNANLAHRIQYQYNTAGHKMAKLCFIDNQEAKELWFYDSLGRCIESIDPLGASTKTSYENAPFLTEITTDPLNLKTVKKYDALNRLTSIEVTQGTTLSKREYRHDFRGNILEERALVPRNIVHLSKYDLMGRLIEKNEAAGSFCAKITKHSYDRMGRLTQTLKPNGIALNYTYHPCGDLLSLISSDGTVHYSRTYDRLGRCLTTYDWNTDQTAERAYDPQGNLLLETFPTGYTISYTYDSLGRPTLCTLPDLSLISYKYDSLFLRKIVRYGADHSLKYTHTYSRYDESGHILEEQLIGNLGLITHSYNLRGQKEHIASPYLIQQIEKRDAVGNILAYRFNNDLHVLSYDELYQITKENEHTYLMDANFCRLQKDEESYETNDLMQLTSHFEYDANGNAIRHKDTEFVYDALDRLIQVKTPNSQTEYTYDFDSRRLTKTLFQDHYQIHSFYLYDGHKEIGAANACGQIVELRVLNPTFPSEIGATVAIERGQKVYAAFHDLTGNLCQAIPLSGDKKYEPISYTAFGEEDHRNTISSWRYSSKRYDPETDLVYFGRRYYSPALGCWLTPDPAQSTSNLYAFVQNNPFRYLDLFGLYTSDRASDVHFFDSHHTITNNFSIGSIGEGSEGTVHYFCGIGNSKADVEKAQSALYHVLDEKYAVDAQWIHKPNLLAGFSLVLSEKLAKKGSFVLCPALSFLSASYLKSSYVQDVIHYQTDLLSKNAQAILLENNPRLKQVHVLFSNASFSFREALRALPTEYQDTIIVLSEGPTTLIESNLAHRVFNIIGDQDWPSRMCTGLIKPLIDRKGFDVEFIPQKETQWGVIGHYFEQPQYQKQLAEHIQGDIGRTYEIY